MIAEARGLDGGRVLAAEVVQQPPVERELPQRALQRREPRRVHQSCPSTAIVALTAHDEEAYVLALLDAGASGYLSKASRGQQVVQAVRAAAAGETVLSGSVAASVTRRALGGDAHTRAALTTRELDVLRAAARGLGNKQIAVELSMSARTVQTHLTRVFAKLGVGSRTEAVLVAMRQGLVRADLS